MYEQLLSLIVATGLLLGSSGPAPLAPVTGATFGALGVVALFTNFPGLKLTVQILGAF